MEILVMLGCLQRRVFGTIRLYLTHRFLSLKKSNETLATLRRLIQTSDMPSDNFQMGDSS